MRHWMGWAGAAALMLAACEAPQGAAPAQQQTGEFPGHQETSPGFAEADFRYRIEALADDRFAGRMPGDPRGEASADWIAAEMERIGLEPAGENGTFFQSVPLIESTKDESRSSFDIVINGESMGLHGRRDVTYWSQDPVEHVAVQDSGMVFVGYGVVAPEYGWDDYAGLDVTGKTVVMLVNDPGYARPEAGRFNGRAMTYYGRWTYKFEEAARQGAAGAIIVHQTAPASYGWSIVENSWNGPQLILDGGDESFVPVQSWIQESVAERLFEVVGLDFQALAQAAAEPGFAPVPLNGASMSSQIHNDLRRISSRNVAGRVTGAERPEEHLIYLAHWDHLGERTADTGEVEVFNGAIDNATGVAMILELAEAFASADNRPARSVMFLAVTAEEQGLLGSEFYARNPLVPLSQTVGGFNFDALLPTGPVRDVRVVGLGNSQMDDILREEAEARGRVLTPEPNPEAGSFYRSDHISLARRGVPMIYASGGIDHVEFGRDHGAAIAADYRARYHQPSDEFNPDWDFSGYVVDAELFYAAARRITDSDVWPNWHEGNEFRGLRDAMME